MDKQNELGIRPWGSYLVLDENQYSKIKIITVKPKGKLSLQYHNKRSEHWYVVRGSGLFTLGDTQTTISSGNSVDIPLGEKHRIENTGNEDLIFVEVQTGESFEETDIVRINDDYGRH